MKTIKKSFILSLICFFSILSLDEPFQGEPAGLAILAEVKVNEKSPFYLDTENYPTARSDLPIGIFDSGTGGLTVLNAILELDAYNNTTRTRESDDLPDFESEGFIYLGDEANMPYGRYSAEEKTDFLRELILKDLGFLLGTKYYGSPKDILPQTDKEPVKAVVIACNTATAYGLEDIQKALRQWQLDIDVIGIIDAAAQKAIETVAGRGHKSVIGVMATEGTCASDGYPKAIRKWALDKIPHGEIAIVQQAGMGLAGAIEGDAYYIDHNAAQLRGEEHYRGPGIGHPAFPIHLSLLREYHFEEDHVLLRRNPGGGIVDLELNSVVNYIRYHVTHLVINALKEYGDFTLSAVILGCTHYPFFIQEIRDHFSHLRTVDQKYAAFIPEDIVIIDPARSVAIELYRILKGKNLFATIEDGESRFYISVPNPFFPGNRIDDRGEFLYTYKYGRHINQSREYVKRVPLTDERVDDNMLKKIESTMPVVYDLMHEN